MSKPLFHHGVADKLAERQRQIGKEPARENPRELLAKKNDDLFRQGTQKRLLERETHMEDELVIDIRSAFAEHQHQRRRRVGMGG